MDFSISSIMASFIFSVMGLYVYRYGKRTLNTTQVIIGIGLMIYSYFTPTPILTWATGLALSGAAYYFR